jgi:hypothetical protein
VKKQFEDTNFDDLLNKFDSDLMWKKSKKQELKKRIFTDIEHLDSKDKNMNAFKLTQSKKISLTGKIAYSCVGFILFFGLFIGSGFVSPVIAEVISKIPYLNQVFKTEPITTAIMNKLKNNGYNISSMGTTGKKIEIGIGGSDGYFQDVQKDVKKIALEDLKSRNYDAYTVKVFKDNSTDEKPSQEILMKIEESGKISESLKQALKISDDYSIQVTPTGNSNDELLIYIEIPNTEKNLEAIKEVAQNAIKEITDKNFKLEFLKIDLNTKDQENRWGRVVYTIYRGLLSKKEYQVKDVYHTSKHHLMSINIETTISSANANTKQLGMKIENTVEEFLKSEVAREFIKDDEYQIIVYSKEKQKIN